MLMAASAGVWLLFQIHSCIYDPADHLFVSGADLVCVADRPAGQR